MRIIRTWRRRRLAHARIAKWSGLITAVVLASCAAPAFAETPETPAPTAPHWQLETRPAPTNLPLGHEGVIVLTASNFGDAELLGESKPVTISDRLPAGLEATEVVGHPLEVIGQALNKSSGVCSPPSENPVKCTFKGDLAPYELLEVLVRVRVNAVTTSPNVMTVTGGETDEGAEASPATPLSTSLKVNDEPTRFGAESLASTPQDDNFEEDHQAGSQPFQVINTFNLNQTTGEDKPHSLSGTKIVPTAPALEKDVTFKLPRGLIGNPNAVPQCPGVLFAAVERDYNACPSDAAIGVATVTINEPITEGYQTYSVPVFNLVPPPGEPAQFGFEVLDVPVVFNTHIRTGEDYGVTVEVREASQTVQVLGGDVTLWGDPSDPRHNSARGWACLGHGLWEREKAGANCEAFTGPQRPFLTLPTSCEEELTTTVSGDAWDGEALTGDTEYRSPALTGCQKLPFSASMTVEPDQHEASTPTGLTLEMSMPQESTLAVGGLAEADVRATTVELPEDMQTSAGGANGLESCPAAQIGFSGADGDTGTSLEQALEAQQFTGPDQLTSAAQSCPNASKVGTVSITSPILERELTGSVYLGDQDTDPFASPLTMYIVAEEKAPGEANTSQVLVKLAGEVQIRGDGQLVSVFKNSPPAPFEHLRIHLFNGSGAAQATPAFCGVYHARATLTPWSGAAAIEVGEQEGEGFQITSGPGGGPCPGAALPFSPSMSAGSTNTQAAAFSPFSLTIDRPDGDQAIDSVAVHLPEGVAALVSTVTQCSEPPAGTEWSCGPASEIGESTASSGLGGEPFTLKGKVYLTTGYDGAPFGVLDATLVKAGPFDLGWVYVRSRINIDPVTGAATITTDGGPHGDILPTMLKGVPVQLKQLNVIVNRQGFEVNPTNCTPMSVTGTLGGEEGAGAGTSSPFGVTNCAGLPFTPTLTAAVAAQASKADGATFRLKITSPGLGQANIHKVDLTIPKILPARLTTIQKACPEATFNANPASCDEGSVVGVVTVHTPLLKSALTGPAYLVSHASLAFPDVVVVLQGEGITLDVTGTTYIHDGITYSKFDSSPDAPFTSFETELPAGPHSILTAYVPASENYNLCKQKLVIPTEITAQDGVTIKQQTQVALIGCKGVAAYKTTRAQKLAKAIKACKRDKKKHRRRVCEAAARKKYGDTKGAKRSPSTARHNRTVALERQPTRVGSIASRRAQTR